MSPDQIIMLVDQYKYWILLPFMIFEGPIATVVGGFLASIGVLDFFLVYLLSVLGDMIGDSVWFFVGRSSRGKFLSRILRFLGIGHERFEKLEAHFKKNAMKTLFLGKLIYGFETVSLVAAGAAKMPFLKFTFYTMLPTIPKSLLFVLVGYYFGSAYDQISKYLDNVGLAVAIVVGIAVVLFFVYRYFFRKASKAAEKEL
jgi:membrane protein DedA with SNARE-associated domain